MYLDFYGLKEPPFSITPDPRFVFLSDRHRDALAHLLYGIGQGGSGGFVQLTGEVGTGKTTLSRLLLEQLPDKTRVALLLNPRVSPIELLESICEEFNLDISHAKGSQKALVDTLNQFLLDAYAQGLRIVLIVDEAQNLSVECLEQVRLLTNLETPTQKLLQIILLGQPELRSLLEREDLRQLAQRITARYHLTPLDETETGNYLRHRLAVAGNVRFPFTRLAVRAVFKRSKGVPRVINIIADRALIAGYVTDAERIGERLVQHAADEVLGKRQRRLEMLAAIFAVTVAAAAIIWLARGWHQPVVVAVQTTVDQPRADYLASADFTQLIDQQDQAVGLAAWSHLLSLWQVDAQRVDVQQVATCPAVIYPGLHCMKGSGNLTRIRSVGRPVIVMLRTEQRISPALLLGSDASGARLDMGIRTISVTSEAFDSNWFGEYFVVWRAPEFLPNTIKRGDVGAASAWVKQRLLDRGKLDSHQARTPVVFDVAMETAVRELQLALGLSPDGIVGPETQWALNGSEAIGPRLMTSEPP